LKVPDRKLPVDERRKGNNCEYILELCTERATLVGCNGVAHVIAREYGFDTYRGVQCELYANKGGNTR